MFFSCIVPVYNIDAELLHKCISSILEQSFQDFELIIVDDGSSEKTARICDQISDKDNRIVVVHQENAGLAGARNTGISLAKGEWIVHIDGDDWIADDLLECVYQCISNSDHKDVDIVYFGYSTVNGQREQRYLLADKSVLSLERESLRVKEMCAALTVNEEFKGLALNTTWGKAFRREFILRSGIVFDVSLRRSQDVPYSLEAFCLARHTAYIDRSLYFYRLDNESLSRGYNEKTMERMRKTAECCQQFVNAHKEIKELDRAGVLFCRRCFRNVITNDYLNPNNPSGECEKKKNFRKALALEPFCTAFKVRKDVKAGSLRLRIEDTLISSGSLELIRLMRQIQALAIKLLKK